MKKYFYKIQILPYADDWEENAKIPSIELYEEMGKLGILAA